MNENSVTIHPRTRSYVDSAVLKLGPERALDALVAFDGNEDDHGWDRCVLGRAYGRPGELEQMDAPPSQPAAELRNNAIYMVWVHAGGDGFKNAMKAFGMTAREVTAVIRCYDDDEPGRGYLRMALLREAAKMVPASEKAHV